MNTLNYLMWIGNQFYSRESYIEEAKKMGASKRVAYIPHGLRLGESKMYLISDMDEKEREVYFNELKKRHSMAYFRAKETGKKSLKGYGPMPRGEAVVFGYFIVNGIVRTIGTPFQKERDDIVVEPYILEDGVFGTMGERGCGSLKPTSYYIISERSMKEIIELYNNPDKYSKNIVVFDKPVPYFGKHFRGVEETKVEY